MSHRLCEMIHLDLRAQNLAQLFNVGEVNKVEAYRVHVGTRKYQSFVCLSERQLQMCILT